MISIKKTLLTLFVVCYSLFCTAQQIPHYTQYLYNTQIINPATVGLRSDLSMSLLTRQQWVGVTGAPTTNTFSINGRTNNGLGFGATVINDKVGLSKSNNINVDASYTLITSRDTRLAFGLKAGITLFDNNLSQGITPDNDTYNNTKGNYPNIGFGAYYYNKQYFVGFSIPYLLKSSQFEISETITTQTTSSNMNYFITGGVRLKLSENIFFKPSTMVKYVKNLPISIDINSNFLYKEFLEAGVSYRYKDSASAMFAIIIDKKYRIGYAYDTKLSALSNNFNTHEIVLHVDFTLKGKGRWLEHNSCYF
ncbi:PorP/SprF family type IX secretion system membrane protein [Tenacibaculum salmonis]|uniref:PorP/SprF family type IX secretion system membrane protein n=1 Tax=Tenacibaculum sp. P3-BQ1 TaxID=3232310 RepID=UPI0034DFF386